MYDAMSTCLYETTSDGQPVETALGMRIAGQSHIDAVTSEQLVDEGRSWGLTERLATRTVNETTQAITQVESPIERLPSLISDRLP